MPVKILHAEYQPEYLDHQGDGLDQLVILEGPAEYDGTIHGIQHEILVLLAVWNKKRKGVG